MEWTKTSSTLPAQSRYRLPATPDLHLAKTSVFEFGSDRYLTSSSVTNMARMDSYVSIISCECLKPCLEPKEQEKVDILSRMLEPCEQQSLHAILAVLQQQEQEKLLNVLEVLGQLEHVQGKLLNLLGGLGQMETNKLLQILEELQPLEQFRVIRLLQIGETLKRGSIIRPIHFVNIVPKKKPLQQSEVLGLLERLAPLEHKKLLGILTRMYPLKQEELLLVLVRLQVQEQTILLRLLGGMEQEELLIQLKQLELTEQESLLRLLEGLEQSDRVRLVWLLKSFNPNERGGLMRLLTDSELESRQNNTLLTLLERCCIQKAHISGKQTAAYQVLDLLEELESLDRKKMLQLLEGQDILEQLELVRLMRKLEQPEQKKLLKLTEEFPLKELLGSLKPLQPLEQKSLLRVLEELQQPERIRLMSLLKYSELGEQRRVLRLLAEQELLEQGILLRLLEVQKSRTKLEKPPTAVVECVNPEARHALLSLVEELKPLERGNVLRLLEGQDHQEQSKLLQLLKGLEPLERLKQIRLLEILKSFNLLKLLNSVEPQERLELMRLLEVELKRLEKLAQEAERLERLKLLPPLEAYKRLLQHIIEWLSVYLCEEGHRGGFRNLLLDGWWLEFWEIILLAAGDVERNPGPRRMTDEQLMKVDNRALEKSDLFDVYDAIHGCRVNWHNLCLALRISDNDLSAINREQCGNTEACLRKGLSRWLQGDYDVGKHGPPSWKMLVDAVANSTGGNDHKLALDIAEQHKVIEAVPSQTSKCFDLERSKQMSSAFSVMYCSVIRLLRVNVRDVKDSLRFLTDPCCLDRLCVPPHVYEEATSTKELLSCLCPDYINPKNTFVLEEIVATFGSHRCKEFVRKYTDKFH